MNIITLNIWGGRAGEEKLLAFFDQYRDSTDIFCLQEVWSSSYDHLDGHLAGGKPLDHTAIMTDGLTRISASLPDHTAYFRPHFLDDYGLLLFARKDLVVHEEGELFVHKHKGYFPEGDLGNHARNIQYVTVEKDGVVRTVVNFHGLWNGAGKTDTDDRLRQSEKIISFLKGLSTEVIVCGDFNLLPDTQSLRMFTEAGYRNLIEEYKITSTRTSLYDKAVKFADYIFVSPGVSVTHCSVLPEEVSDHAALLLECT